MEIFVGRKEIVSIFIAVLRSVVKQCGGRMDFLTSSSANLLLGVRRSGGIRASSRETTSPHRFLELRELQVRIDRHFWQDLKAL